MRSASLGLYSLSERASYRKLSRSLKAARFGFRLFQSLWNLTGTSAAPLRRCLSNFRTTQLLLPPISWLWDFTKFDGKTSYRLVNRGPGHRLLISFCSRLIVVLFISQRISQIETHIWNGHCVCRPEDGLDSGWFHMIGFLRIMGWQLSPNGLSLISISERWHVLQQPG